MTSITDGGVCIQSFSESVPATPSWFGELVLLMTHLPLAHSPVSGRRHGSYFAEARRRRLQLPSSPPPRLLGRLAFPEALRCDRARE